MREKLTTGQANSSETLGAQVKFMSAHFEFRRITTICENYLKLSSSQTEHPIQGQTLKQITVSLFLAQTGRKRVKLKTGYATIAQTLKQITVSLFLSKTGKNKDNTED